MSFLERRDPVFYASLPVAPETLKGCRTNGAGDQAPLGLQPVGSPGGMMRKVLCGKAANPPTALLFPIQVVRGLLGRPHLLLGEIGARPSPSARVEEKSGPPSVEMSLISASMWQGPMNSKENTPFTGSSMARAATCLEVGGRRFGKGLSPALVGQGSRGQGPGMRLPPRGSAANQRLSGGRQGRRVYLSRGLIREGAGAVSPQRRPVHLGAFASPGEDVAFHRPLESARSLRRYFC